MSIDERKLCRLSQLVRRRNRVEDWLARQLIGTSRYWHGRSVRNKLDRAIGIAKEAL